MVFNERLVTVCETYVRKGTKLYLEGQLQTRKWTDQSGTDKYTTEIVLQKFRGEIVLLSGYGNDDKPVADNAKAAAAQNELDDEIPF